MSQSIRVFRPEESLDIQQETQEQQSSMSKKSTPSLRKVVKKKVVKKPLAGSKKSSKKKPPSTGSQSTKSAVSTKSPKKSGKSTTTTQQKGPFFLVSSPLAAASICRRCETLKELKQAVKQELQKSLPQDVRMWVFSGEQYELPSLDPFDTPFSVLFAEDAPKLLSSPDPDKPAESLETGKLFEDDMLDDSQITADDFMSDQPNSLDQNFMF